MPLLIEPQPKPQPLRPPIGNHCRVCGVSLKGAGRRRNRYCVAHRGAEKLLWERKHRRERLEYHRQWMSTYRRNKRASAEAKSSIGVGLGIVDHPKRQVSSAAGGGAWVPGVSHRGAGSAGDANCNAKPR